MKNYTLDEDKLWYSHAIEFFKRFLNPFINQPVHFLEVGTFQGGSALWLLDNVLTHPNSSIFCVDPWHFGKNTQQIFENNLKKCDSPAHVTLEAKTSCQALKELSTTHNDIFDFIYIDGNHQEHHPLEDAVLSFPLLKSGGIMAFDDYRFFDATVGKCVDAFKNIYVNKIKILCLEYQAWFQKI